MSGTSAGPNVFQGVVNPDGKSLTFFGVPILPPVSSGVAREYRITNVRAQCLRFQFLLAPILLATSRLLDLDQRQHRSRRSTLRCRLPVSCSRA